MMDLANTQIQVIKPFRVEFYGLSKHIIKPNIYLVSFVWQNDDPDAVTEGFKEYFTTVSFDTLLDGYKNEEVGYYINFASFDEDTKTLNDLDSIMQDVMIEELMHAYRKQQGLDEHEKDSELKWYDPTALSVRIITRTVEELDLVGV